MGDRSSNKGQERSSSAKFIFLYGSPHLKTQLEMSKTFSTVCVAFFIALLSCFTLALNSEPSAIRAEVLESPQTLFEDNGQSSSKNEQEVLENILAQLRFMKSLVARLQRAQNMEPVLRDQDEGGYVYSSRPEYYYPHVLKDTRLKKRNYNLDHLARMNFRRSESKRLLF